MQLTGRSVLVTGGASGLGLATAEMIVAPAGVLGLVDINEQAETAVAARLGGAARFVKTHVTSDAEMQRGQRP
jgi:NAD(P)-dependent dehydrogenase (short-subunit alcohol dehydrogenase family)